MLILVADAFDPSLVRQLSTYGEVSEDPTSLPEAEILLIRSKTKCSQAYLSRATRLKLIIRGGVGLDNVDLEYASSRGIEVRNTPQASSIAVAEMAMTLMLGAANFLAEAHMGMIQGRWLKNHLQRRELFSRTLGLIGVGRVGRAVAQRARAFGMHVIGHDPFIPSSALVDLMTLDAVLQQVDVLSLHCTATEATRNIINAETLALLRPSTLLVNTSSGECVDEDAVVNALVEGRLGCYATDVYAEEPPASDNPLLRAPRVLLSPHLGGTSRESSLRMGEEVLKTLEQFLR